MRKFVSGAISLILLTCLSLSVIAQQKSKPISWKDVSGWKSIQNSSVTLSPDGQWLAYAIHPVEGDGELILQKVNDTLKRVYSIGGAPSFSVKFSEDGKWFAYKEFPKDKDRKAALKQPGKMLFDKLYLVNLSSWEKTEYEKAGNYEFNGKASNQLAVQILKDRMPGVQGGGGNDLMITELKTKKSFSLGNIGDFSFNKAGDWMAYTVDAVGQSGNGVNLMNVANRQFAVVDNEKANYQGLNWHEDGNAFAVLKMKKDEKFKNDKGSVIGVKNLSLNPTVIMYDPIKDSVRFPKGMTVSPNRNPYWSDDLGRLMFGIHNNDLVKKDDPSTKKDDPSKDSVSVVQLAKLKTDTSIKSLEDLQRAIAKLSSGNVSPGAKDTLKPDMTIWHYQDKRLQSRQQVQETMDKRLNYLAVYDVTANRFFQVQDSSLSSVVVLPKQMYAVGIDNRAYELDGNLDGQTYLDLYVVDLKTGERRKVMDKYYVAGYGYRGLWNGTQFVYAQDGSYHVYDIPSAKSVNITAKVPASFINTEDDHNVTKPLLPVIDISKDSKYLLIRDLWDIWMVPVNPAEAAKNLTGNGKTDKIRYQYAYQLDPEAKGFDPASPIYLRMYGEWNKKAGIGRLSADKKGIRPGAEVLKWEDADVYGLRKAKNADVYVFGRETFTKPTEFYASGDALLNNEKKLTSNAPLADKYAWSSGVQLVNCIRQR